MDARERAVIGAADLNRYNGVLICFSTNEVTHVLHFVQVKRQEKERRTYRVFCTLVCLSASLSPSREAYDKEQTMCY